MSFHLSVIFIFPEYNADANITVFIIKEMYDTFIHILTDCKILNFENVMEQILAI